MSSRLDEARAALDQARANRTPPAPTLFDDSPPKERATRSVERNASDEWHEHAIEAVRAAARRRLELTIDDVRPFITKPVNDTLAIGAVMLRAARAGIIERQIGQFRISGRPETHSRPLALWRSLIYMREA